VTFRKPSGEAGVSLIETAAVLMIMGIVMTFVGQAFVSVHSDATGADIRLQNLDEARILINTLTKDVRTAAMITGGSTPFVLAEPTKLTFYGNLNTTTVPNKIEIYLDSTNPSAPVLFEKITPPDPGTSPPTYNTQPAKTRLVGKYVVNTNNLPLFIYYDANIAAISPIAPAVGLSASQMLQIRSVGISLAVRKATSRSVPATTIMNRVRLPNVYFNVQS
jgi:hypothetical protein